MTRFSYSVNSLLLGVMNFVLLVGTLSSLGAGKPADDVAMGGLSLCTLFFSLLCGLMGQSAPRILLLSATFYAWGVICLLLGESCELHIVLRLALAILGVSYVSWAWLSPAVRSSGL
jgi:hypothetical protein